MTRNVLNNRRSRTGCSILALATVLAVGASPASAQSFAGTGSFSSGTGSITTSPNTTAISVTSPTAVINWIPTDNVANPNVPIVFQPGGTFADFSGGGNYAVLNRINVADASRVIQLDGTIRTVASGALTGTGSIYFYSPSGFLLGGSSVINVPSLVLSALPIVTDGSGNFIIGADRTVTFGPAVSATASITAMPGSQITTNLTGSYVAMVAPRVAHHGTITNSGQTALVAAEAATINFSPDGLFDISVTTGTLDANGIALHGDINGDASTGVGDNNRIYAVAVPKNDALTMVIGSGADLGFAIAGAANVDGNAIVLSAGHNVTNGLVDTQATSATSEAAMVINAPRATSAFTAVASGNLHLFANPGQVSNFASNVTLRGDNQAWASASGAGSLLSIAGNLHLSTDESAAASGGSAEGGETSLYALGGGTVTVTGTALLTANAYGGSTESSGQTGGTGTGGLVIVRANDTGSSVTVTGALTAEANGFGGTSFDGNGGAGFGGATANGGGVTIEANGGILALNGGATASANGVGGDAYAAGTTAGAGTGGRAGIYAINGGVAGVGGNATLTAGGDGGTHWGGGTGGVGTGGTAELDTSGAAAAQINIGGSAYLSAIGAGGDSFNISEGPLGDGGDAVGGRTRAAANQGLIRVTGNLDMDSTVSGGSGATGGDAAGITTPSTDEGLPPAAIIWAGSANAEVRVTGLTDIDVSATGGTGYNGSGGSASGGEIDIVSQLGHVNLGNVVANADADGGDGGNGGTGGAASGGAIDVSWSVDGGPLTGTISAGAVTLSAIGQGGNGGVGATAAAGGSGGAGGSGTGGGVSYVGNAAGGTFNVGATTIVADGRGGNGGSGGIGTAGVGGTGGAGGSGTGGFIQTGNISISGNPGSGGTATFTNLSASSGATGGNGGNGGSGSGGAGTGGAGGNATAGQANFLVRGIAVTANTINLVANATGGNGGSGSTAGIGGNAFSGFVSAESKDRFDHADQRGSLTASAINGTAMATGGTGAVNGTSTVRGGSYFRVLNGDADIGSVNFQFSGAAYDNSFGPHYIQAEDGTATVGTLSFGTTGDLAIYTTNTGALDVGTLTLSAGNFIDHPTLAGPASPGTISATNLTVTSGGDFFADANLNVTNGIGITVPGSIRFDNATSDSFVDLWAQSGSISLDDVNADGYVSLDAGGAISVGVLSAGIDIDLDAIGNIVFTSASAGSDFDFYSEGSVTGGNVVAVQEISGHANGSVSLGNLTAGPPDEDDASVGISAVGNISVGNVTGAGLVGFATQGNLLAGTINAGDLFLAMVGGNFTSGAIATTGEAGGQVYVADDSMFVTGGGTWDDEGDFDPSIVLALDPVRTGGAITINGAVNTGLFRAAAGTNLTVGAISSGDGIGLDANGSIITGNLVAGNFVLANGGSITTGSIDADSVEMESTGGNITIGGDVTANGLVELDAFGNIVTDNITAGTIELAAGGSITTDNLTTELPLVLAAADFQGMPDVDPDGVGNIVVIAGGNILTGDITAAESILLVTPGAITGEEIEAGNIFMALAHGDMVFGNATAAEVFLADFAMYSPGGGGEVSSTCNGVCGTLGPDGVITAPPPGGNYTYVTTAGSSVGAGRLAIGGTNGSDYTTSEFTAAAGDDLEFWFNYVTSDGGGFADYAWASLLTSNLDPVAILFTARTQASGTIVPGFGLPDVEATLNPASVPIIDGGPAWSPLGGSSGGCYSAGCGYTGWVNSTYEIAEAGDYVLRFGVTNWSDSGYDSGMAFSGITIGGVPVESGLLSTGGSITIGNVNAGKMTAAAGTTLTTGIIDVSDFANLVSGGNMVTNAITAGNNLWADAGGTMTLGVLSGGDIELNSDGNMSFVSANAGTEFDFSSDGSVNGGNVTAGNQISGDAGGAVTLANLTVSGAPQEGENFSIGITALGNITVGNVSGAGPVGFGTPEDLTTGNVTAGDLFLTLVGGDIAINGSITTTGEASQVYMADYSMCETGGGCTDDGEGDDGDENDFDPSIVLGLDPVMTGGSIAITGPVSTGVFRAAAGTTFNANNISANGAFSNEEIFVEGINVRAGGLATINGTWSGPDVNVVSNDIDITGTGSINAGDVELYSTNATQTVVGDGVAGGGYQLSDAEFDRINVNGELEVGAWVGGGAADRMMFGDLTYTDDSEGSIEIEFAVFEDDSEFGDGSMRVVGDMVFNGMSGDDSVQFATGLFELDAATGSVSLFSSGTSLGGDLILNADRIHVAAGGILDQLATNPTYSGYQQDLNEPATVQRPEGVLRADTLWIESDNLLDVLIQNTGTGGQSGVPAGFLVRQAFINDEEEVAGPPGSINMVVNGQVQTEGGTLTGVAARDALIDEETDTAAFTSNSTINGCPLTGACIIQNEEPPPNPDVVDDQIDLINGNPLGDGDFGNEDSIDDNEEGDEGAENPISPPQPLFDTRPLVPSGDVSDPVSGTGNPALTGGEAECEEDEGGECPAEQSDGGAQ